MPKWYIYLQASSLLGHFHNGLLLHRSFCCVCKKWWQSGKKKSLRLDPVIIYHWLPAWGNLWPSHWQPEPRCPASHHHEGRAPLRVRHHHWPCLSLALGLPTWPVSCSVKLRTESLTGLLWRVNAITHVKYFFYEFQKACVAVMNYYLVHLSAKKKKKARKKYRKWPLNK